MYFDTIIAGFGGQGVMFIGNLLATAAMEAGANVTYMPVYGVEMRGGTANCTVVISSRPIGSPLVYYPMSTLVMNRPSAEKFAPRVKRSGFVLVNSSLVEREQVPAKTKRVYMVPALELAAQAGESKLANMVMLGAMAELSGVVSVSQIVEAMNHTLEGRPQKLLELNRKALEAGAEFAQEKLMS